MSKDPKRQRWLWLVIPPLFFTVKDFLAIQYLWSHEPGITEEVANNFALLLLPGTLFFVAGSAPVVNLAFGIVLVLALCLLVRRYHRHSPSAEIDKV